MSSLVVVRGLVCSIALLWSTTTQADAGHGTYIMKANGTPKKMTIGTQEVSACGPEATQFHNKIDSVVVEYSGTVLVNKEEWKLEGSSGDTAAASKPQTAPGVKIQVWFTTRGKSAVGALI